MKWQYGVTTVPERVSNLLPQTLKSLAASGFDKPTLFVDGLHPSGVGFAPTHETVVRWPRIRTYGNWWLTAHELWIRDPYADRYAIFQDDFVCVSNLREYLERVDYPEDGYLNLYTFPQNEQPKDGFYLSNQLGKGAVALVFNNNVFQKLLASDHMVNRPRNKKRGHKAVDGGIVTGLKKVGVREYVHNPSLVQHTGIQSSMGNSTHQLAATFPGEDFDALLCLHDTESETRVSATVREPERRRIGLVGYNCRNGLGELNRQLATHLDIDKWLVKPHGRRETLPPHPDVDTTICRGERSKIDEWLNDVDVVLFCETPYFPSLVQQAAEKRKRIVCVPMQEWMPPGCKGWPEWVHLFVCPTLQCYAKYKDRVPCVDFSPWPCDIDRFEYKHREVCNRFLFINGHGGVQGRKGAGVVKDVLKLGIEFPLTVITQKEDTGWPDYVNVQYEHSNNSSLYDEGDVLIAPHYFDGLGLEFLEAASAGMPVISTDGAPWNQYPAIHRIACKRRRRKVGNESDYFAPIITDLHQAMVHWLGRDISDRSHVARTWAEKNKWSLRVNELTTLLRTGEHCIAVTDV